MNRVHIEALDKALSPVKPSLEFIMLMSHKKGIKPPRLVVYGIGQYGALIVKLAVQKGWPVIAAFNRAGPKVGQDLGRVVGLDRDLGVIIQDCETGDYDNLDADIGIVTSRDMLHLNIHAHRRFLNAGLNVGCHGTESYLPYSCDPVIAREIDELAKKKGVTFTGSGIWDMSRIWSGILAAGPCTDIRSINLSSLTNAESQTNSLEQVKQFCISEPRETFYEKGIHESALAKAFKTVPEHVLIALGYTIIESTATVEPVIFDEPVKTRFVPEGYFPAGVVVGVRVLTKTTTREGIVGTAQVESRMCKPGEIEHMLWEIDGMPHSRLMVERRDSAHMTAASLFNRIPDIIAAPPGIVPVSRLGPMKSSALL